MDDRIRPPGDVPQRELKPALVRAVQQLRKKAIPQGMMQRVLDQVRLSRWRSSLWLRTLLRGETMPN